MSLYRTPCGQLTSNRKRKRHNWVLEVPALGGTLPVSFEEDYAAACREVRKGGRLVLYLDGVRVGFEPEEGP